MDEKQLSIDIVGLLGACSYALDCIEAELVNVSNKHGKRVAYMSVCMANYWNVEVMHCKIWQFVRYYMIML